MSDYDRSGLELNWPPTSRLGQDPHPHAEAYGLAPDHVYGSDDDPAGPPAPPLPADELPHTVASGLRFYPHVDDFTPATPVVACPTCGSGVAPDRLRG